MLSVEMLPARHGDCLWVEYGTARERHRILVDGGPGFAYADGLRAKVEAIPASRRRFELAVCTHIDADHIEGTIRLLGEPGLGCAYGEVWHNAWPQVSAGMPESFGAVHGEYLAALIRKRRLAWNRAFPLRGGVRTAMAAPDLGAIELPGGARLTLLSPDADKLAALAKVWDRELERAGIAPDEPEEALERLRRDRKFRSHVSFGLEGPDPRALAAAPFTEDPGAPNGSSIAFLLEAGGGSALLLGDAHPGLVAANLDRLLARRRKARLEVDIVKLPHHGSENNVNRELVERIAGRHWLFSSDGTFFDHPDPEAVARVLTGDQDRPNLVFNYRTKRTAIWDDDGLQRAYRYRAAGAAIMTAHPLLRPAHPQARCMTARKTIPIRVRYDCSKCPGYCCTYEHIPVTKRDVARLARHFGLAEAAAAKRFTKPVGDGIGLRHRRDGVYRTACMFLDPKARRCTVYESRPTVCRSYPDGAKCGYYDFLKFERDFQDDETFVPSA